MSDKSIKYVECKYCLHETFHYELKTIRPNKPIGHRQGSRHITLTLDGLLIIHKGYPWDGASGPTIDTNETMRNSLVHDGLYELFRWGLLDPKWRDEADEELRSIGVEDGMNPLRAQIWEWAVDTFAEDSSTASGKRPVLDAP